MNLAVWPDNQRAATLSKEWRDVAGFSGYQVSACGEVRSNKLCGPGDWKPIKLLESSRGYYIVQLTKDGKRRTKRVHRLVLEAFGNPVEGKNQVAHWDGDKKNNRLENLRWATPKENSQDNCRLGLVPFGAQVHCAKLTNEGVRQARKLYAQGMRIVDLARKYGVSTTTIRDAITGKTWGHVK